MLRSIASIRPSRDPLRFTSFRNERLCGAYWSGAVPQLCWRRTYSLFSLPRTTGTANVGANSALGSTVRERTEYRFAFCTVVLDLLPESGGNCENVARLASVDKRPWTCFSGRHSLNTPSLVTLQGKTQASFPSSPASSTKRRRRIGLGIRALCRSSTVVVSRTELRTS